MGEDQKMQRVTKQLGNALVKLIMLEISVTFAPLDIMIYLQIANASYRFFILYVNIEQSLKVFLKFQLASVTCKVLKHIQYVTEKMDNAYANPK